MYNLSCRDALIQKKLYKFLLSPIDDLLSQLHPGGHIIIIPDRAISEVPFPLLRDLRGQTLSEKYKMTLLPGLFALRLVSKCESGETQGQWTRILVRLGCFDTLLWKKITSLNVTLSY